MSGVVKGVTALAPVVVYLFLVFRPETTGWAARLAFAALAACLIAAWFKRGGAAVGAALLVVGMLFAPKAMWMIHMKHCGMDELAAARQRIDAFKGRSGRPPKDLAELGELPALRIWTVDERGGSHTHRLSKSVNLRRSGQAPPDDGEWGYDLHTGRVFLSCTGLEPKLRRTPLYEL